MMNVLIFELKLNYHRHVVVFCIINCLFFHHSSVQGLYIFKFFLRLLYCLYSIESLILQLNVFLLCESQSASAIWWQ